MALVHLGKNLQPNDNEDDEGPAAFKWDMNPHAARVLEADECPLFSYISVVSRSGSSGTVRFDQPRKLKGIFDRPWLPRLQSLIKTKPSNRTGDLTDTTDIALALNDELLKDCESKDYFFEVDDE